MIPTNLSFRQLHETNEKAIELEGVVVGAIIILLREKQGLQFSLAPHGEDMDCGFGLDRYVTVYQPGEFGGDSMKKLQITEQLGNRVHVQGTYTHQESEKCIGRIDADLVEITEYS